jgi:hypothetical protein
MGITSISLIHLSRLLPTVSPEEGERSCFRNVEQSWDVRGCTELSKSVTLSVIHQLTVLGFIEQCKKLPTAFFE